MIASSIFSEIGIHIDWRRKAGPCPEGIVVQFSDFKPRERAVDELAFARPDLSSIVIFSARIAQAF